MQCGETRDLLSAYLDNELPAELRSAVAGHLQSCATCRGELRSFQELSKLARSLTDPPLPDGIWEGIESGLTGGREGPATVRAEKAGGWLAGRRRLSVLAAAALILLAVGMTWIIAKTRHAPGSHSEMAAYMQDFLERFPHDPARAEQLLLAKYDGQPVDVSRVRDQLGFQPIVATGLPKRYTMGSVHLLKMPCCTCLQAICRRDDGKVYAIFEHDSDHPACFGSHGQTDVQCQGCTCHVAHADRELIASWQVKDRQLTVVGAQDLEEIADLISHFSDGSPES